MTSKMLILRMLHMKKLDTPFFWRKINAFFTLHIRSEQLLAVESDPTYFSPPMYNVSPFQILTYGLPDNGLDEDTAESGIFTVL